MALARSVARVARQGTQAAHAHLHEIECVERLGLNSLMRALHVELKCADRGTKFYCGDFDRSIPEYMYLVELSLFYCTCTRRVCLYLQYNKAYIP